MYNLEDDPNLHITYDPDYQITAIEFAAANVGYRRGELEPVCDTPGARRFKLEYDIYVRFLPYTDPSVNEVFTEVERMATVKNVEKYGKKVKMRI